MFRSAGSELDDGQIVACSTDMNDTPELFNEIGRISCNSMVFVLWSFEFPNDTGIDSRSPLLWSSQEGATRKFWIRSKQPIVAATAGTAESSFAAGSVTKEIIANEVNAWSVVSESEPRSFAWMEKATKVRAGAKMNGTFAALIRSCLALVQV